jgi:hypothetical protein
LHSKTIGDNVTERLEQLERICSEISANPKATPLEVKRAFWRIVREIKRESTPDPEEIMKAAQIRDILFEVRRGKTYALRPALGIMFASGIALSVVPFLYLMTFPLDWMNIVGWTLQEWGVFGLRFLTVFAGVALFYPIGRLVGARLLGIKIMGVCWDDYKEPTLKIDYVSFLGLHPTRRKWFFFAGGIWTAITSLLYWIVGVMLAFDFTGLAFALVILVFEGYVLARGKGSYKLGEMGLYNREKKIEQEWRRSL